MSISNGSELSPEEISYNKAVQVAQHQAMRDINEFGEFQNPYDPDSDSVSYYAYDCAVAVWNAEQTTNEEETL